MNIDRATGLLHDARHALSPHCSERPEGEAVNLLVIHNISLPPNQFGGDDIIDFFSGSLGSTKHPFYATIKDQRVSAHFVIDRQGVITQCVPVTKQAWHAGESQFQGRTACNTFSVGIELEGADHIPYEPTQYDQLGKLTHELMAIYPEITVDRIVGHSDIAPNRKTDPGPAFDWRVYRCILEELVA